MQSSIISGILATNILQSENISTTNGCNFSHVWHQQWLLWPPQLVWVIEESFCLVYLTFGHINSGTASVQLVLPSIWNYSIELNFWICFGWNYSYKRIWQKVVLLQKRHWVNFLKMENTGSDALQDSIEYRYSDHKPS